MSTSPIPTVSALSDGDLTLLDQFLDSNSVPEDTMSISMLDGYLAGVACSPQPVSPDEWLPLIWGDEDVPQYSSAQQQSTIERLIVRHAAHIKAMLLGDGEEYDPLFFTTETPHGDVLLTHEWCIGFLEAEGYAEAEWARLRGHREHGALVSQIEEMLETELPEPDEMDQDMVNALAEWADGMADRILDIHAFFHTARLAAARR